VVDVAVLGAGRMGAAMARRVAGAGHQVRLWNRSRPAAEAVAAGEPAITVADAASDAVRGADVVLSVLADGNATRQVLLDDLVVAALAPTSVVCDLGTSGVEAAKAIDAGLRAAGVAFVDAPVSGSVPAVEGGTLLVMAGGPPDAIRAAAPVLGAFAKAVVRVGDAGAGQVMKLAVNLVVHDLNAAVSEALVLAEKAGIARESAYDVLTQSVVAAPFVLYKRSAFLDADTPVAMSLQLTEKDLRLVLELAAQVGAPATVTEAAHRVVGAACADGRGAADMADLSRFLNTTSD
jgi:3-hydroxyisobutyrate dehydrogenase-like beta-hydroxyacid dehydrogenase